VSIMPGKSIGAYAKVGSHTIVSRSVPSHSVYYATQTQQIQIDLEK